MSKDLFRNTLNSSETFTRTEQLINRFSDLKHTPEQINFDEMISSTKSIIIRVANSCLHKNRLKGRANQVTIKVRLTLLVPRILASTKGGSKWTTAGISKTTKATGLNPWNVLGVSFKVSKKFQVDITAFV